MQTRRIIINAIMSVAQVVVMSLTLFILYRFLLETVGIEQLGIWGIVSAFTTATQVGTFGLAGSAVKYVAKYVAREESEKVSLVVQTASITVAIFIGVFILLCYPVMKWLFPFFISSESLPLALSVLPYSLLSFWIYMIAHVFCVSFDGYQRIDIRSFLYIGGAIFHLVLCFFLVPQYGLIGIAYARVLEYLFLLVVAWIVLKKFFLSLPIFPVRFSRSIFKEIIGYGLNIQLIQVSNMLYEPITKSLLSKFGGLTMVGYYEMASKMIQQLRTAIVSATQVIVPAIADLKERTPEKIQIIYRASYQLLFFISLLVYTFIIVASPIVSKIWIGRYEDDFILFSMILSFGWFFSTLSAPAFYSNLGIGELRWNVVGNALVAFLNILLGFLFGFTFDGTGVVSAWSVSLVLGSSIIFVMYHLKYKIPLSEIVQKDSKVIISLCMIFVAVTIALHMSSVNDPVINLMIAFAFVFLATIFSWRHPLKKSIFKRVSEEFLSRNAGDTSN